MSFAFCSVTIAPVRLEPSHKSEMISQLLFGEEVEILQNTFENWMEIKCLNDAQIGWVDEKQITRLEAPSNGKKKFVASPVDYASLHNTPFSLVMGSEIPLHLQDFYFDGETASEALSKDAIAYLATSFLHAPYLWGGRSPFGVDCSGLVQVVFKFLHQFLPRDAYQQADVGQTLSFLEETEVGDLAFFDNSEGKIIHVGILLSPHQIIHAHGKVRIDTIDAHGIFNHDQKKYTHRLRLLKRVV